MTRNVLALCFVLLVVGPVAAEERPNVVLIISDDQAWNDYGFMGHPVVGTPHLDRLAAEGTVFTRGTVPTSLCRPSLATMITGLYPHQHGITGNDPPKGVSRERMVELFDPVVTLPERLAKAGYRSFQSGKWWEGSFRRGGFTAGMTHGDPKRGGRHGDAGLKIGRNGLQPIFDFIADCGEKPWFVWYAPFLPHTPHNPPERLLAKYRADDRSIHVAKYYAMCEWLDETCGELLGYLEEKKLARKTLVIFITDNGWIQREDRRGYAPRSKRSPYESGVRTPIIVRWPGEEEPEQIEEPVSSIDLVPTILTACGLPVPDELPGVDLRRLTGGGDVARPAIFGAAFTHDVVELGKPIRSLKSRWVIRRQWKLIQWADPQQPAELFDLLADPSEQSDLSSQAPDRVERLRLALDGWWSGKG